MLHSLKFPAQARNWLHDCALSLVAGAVSSARPGKRKKSWKNALPAKHRALLSSRSGLKTRYDNCCTAFKTLTPQQLDQIPDIAKCQIGIPQIYSDGSICPQIGALPKNVRDSIVSLFDFAFTLLSEIKIGAGATMPVRDELYQEVYGKMPGHICPFCGIDRFDAPHPDIPRHHLDHYMAISIYPFLGAHLRNLVPMCARCNSSFKSTADVLHDSDGLRRVCADPYGGPVASISLLNSRLFEGAKGECPDWVIDFEPDHEAFKTWDEIFEVRLRYRESVLNAEFKSWLGQFAAWVRDGQVIVDSASTVSEALGRFAKLTDHLTDQGFLKAPMFKLLAAEVIKPTEVSARMIELVKDLCR